MEYVVLILGSALFAVYSIGMKISGDTCIKNRAQRFLHVGLFSAVASLLSFSFCGWKLGQLPWFTWWTVLLLGLIFVLLLYVYLKVLEYGPLSLSVLFMNMSMIFPIIFFWIFRSEKITVLRLMGIILICVMFFSSANLKEHGKPITVKWFLYVLLSVLMNGSVCIINRVYQIETKGAYTAPFTALWYGVAAIIAICLAIAFSGKKRENIKMYFSLKALRLVLIVGVGSFGGNYITSSLSYRIDSSVLFPVILGGSFILVMIGSLLFLKEKLNFHKVITLAFGFLAVILLSI